jgi:hypothetical protein
MPMNNFWFSNYSTVADEDGNARRKIEIVT